MYQRLRLRGVYPLLAGALLLGSCVEVADLPAGGDVVDVDGGPAVGLCVVGTPCNDGDPCTVEDRCLVGGACAGDALVCEDGNPCTVGSCDPASGGCAFDAGDDGAPCAAENACVAAAHCQAGVCAGDPLACEDDNPCTVDGCDPAIGCTHGPSDGLPCDDGDPCTVSDSCDQDVCTPGPPLCTSEDACVVAACDPVTAECTYGAAVDGVPCPDASDCLEESACQAGLCVGSPKDCDDGNLCTDDSCASGGCVSVANEATCGEGEACTWPGQCAEGDCVPGPPVLCDDGNPCTDDLCLPGSGCDHPMPADGLGAPCDDGDPCTSDDQCGILALCAGTPSCECQSDGDCVQENLCLGLSSCVTQPDGTKACEPVPGTAVVCDDPGPCQAVSCAPLTGVCTVSAVTDGAWCDDGDACTASDACAPGGCQGTPIPCGDDNPCTDHGCDPEAGCQMVANTAPCDADGDPCTEGDVCIDTVCVAGNTKGCDALDGSCGQGVCDPGTGDCVVDTTAFPPGHPCDLDGDVCTTDVCGEGVCQGGPTVDCGDGGPCIAHWCDPSLGCQSDPTTLPCDDGSVCTEGDQCAGWACQPGLALTCDDQDPCTADGCDPTDGCVSSPIAGCDIRTYTQHAAPIFRTYCWGCHTSGGIGPMPLDDYDTAALWDSILVDVTAAREMPPTQIVADGSCHDWQDAGWLSDEDLQTLADWVEDGSLEGPPDAMPDPLPPAAGLGGELLELFLPEPYTPVAIGGSDTLFDDYECFLFDPELDDDVFVTGWEVVPDKTAIVHHVIIFTVPPSSLGAIGALQASSGTDSWHCNGLAGNGVEIESLPLTWAPGMNVFEYPEGTGMRIPAGSLMVMQIHYNLINGAQPDQTGVRFQVADTVDRAATLSLNDQFLTSGDWLPAGQTAVSRTWSMGVNGLVSAAGAAAGKSVDWAELVLLFPHMHQRGTTMEIVRKKSGEPDLCLGRVENWDFNWQFAYRYASPVPLTKGQGETIEVTCTWDTSADTSPIPAGLGSEAEMCLFGAYVVAPPSGD